MVTEVQIKVTEHYSDEFTDPHSEVLFVNVDDWPSDGHVWQFSKSFTAGEEKKTNI